MANENQSDVNRVNRLADRIQSTLSAEPADSAEQDIGTLVQNIQLADETITDYAEDLLSPASEPNQDDAPASNQDALDFDTPLFWEKHPRIFFSACIVLIALLIGGFFYYLKSGQQTGNYEVAHLPDQVYVAGIQIGGMTSAQAVTSLEHNLPSFTQKDVVIRFRDESLVLTPEDIQFSLDIDGAVEAASKLSSGDGRRVDLDIKPYARLDLQTIRSLIDSFFTDEESSFVQSSYRLEGTAPMLALDRYDPQSTVQTLILCPGVPGSTLDTNEIFNAFMENYLHGNVQIQIDEPQNNRLPNELNLDEIYRTLYIQPIASRIDADGITFHSGSFGYTFSLEDAQSALKNAPYGSEVSVPMQLVFPECEYSPMFPDELGSCVLPCDPTVLPNARYACQSICGTVVKSGLEFSMKDCFKNSIPASECRNNPVEDDGVCMTASAIYHAALLSGMTSSSASRHPYVVSFTEPSYDVYFNAFGSNLKFQNTTGSPILILTSFANDGIHVRFLGTEYRSYTVELNQVDASKTAFKTEKKLVHQADGYEEGDIIRHGIDGYTGHLELVKRSKETGEVLSTDVVRNLFYEPLPELIANVVD